MVPPRDELAGLEWDERGRFRLIVCVESEVERAPRGIIWTVRARLNEPAVATSVVFESQSAGGAPAQVAVSALVRMS